MDKVDDKIIAGLKNGRSRSLETVYRHYGGKVYNFIHAMVKDEDTAKDLAHDVFLHLWERRANIDCSNNFEGYLFKIAQRIVFHHVRRAVLFQHYLDTMLREPADPGAARGQVAGAEAEHRLDRLLLEEQIARLVEQLPEARRRIFLLYWKKEMSYREIAALLSISEKTVATQVARSLQFLRSQMGRFFVLAAAVLLLE